MRSYVIDIETDGLFDSCTKIHIACVYDIEKEEAYPFRKASDFKKWVYHNVSGSRLILHNGLSFDLPLIRKLWGIPYTIGKTDVYGEFPTEIVDTFQLSSFLWPDRPGGHSLDNLSKLAGSYKMGFNGPWDVWSQDLQTYCIQDTKANASVYEYLLAECKGKYGESE